MKCPACGNVLTAYPAGPIKVDVCAAHCGGIWFDAFELPRVDEMREAVAEGLLKLAPKEELKLDSDQKRRCPKCDGVMMMRHYFSPQRKVIVDECPNCGGFWLDAGELAGVRAETQARKEKQQVTAARLMRLSLNSLSGELAAFEKTARQNPAAARQWHTLDSAVRALASGS